MGPPSAAAPARYWKVLSSSMCVVSLLTTISQLRVSVIVPMKDHTSSAAAAHYWKVLSISMCVFSLLKIGVGTELDKKYDAVVTTFRPLQMFVIVPAMYPYCTVKLHS